MGKDNFNYIVRLFIATILLLLIIGLIPSGNIQYKNFNLLSDLISKEPVDTAGVEELSDELIATACTKKDSIQNDSTQEVEQKEQIESLDENQGMEIVDFSKDGNCLLPFFQSMQNCRKANKTVRIGVLGDSFIEADIMTSKLRGLLQQEYGGMGVGYVPVASPASQYRKTVQHRFNKWTTHSMVYYKKADWKRFCIAGSYYVPSEGASFILKPAKGETITKVSFLFINTKKTKLEVSINGDAFKVYEPESSEKLQCLDFTDNAIKSFEVRVSNADGFTAFGTYLYNPFGVYVDNYSVRGSSGSVLITVNDELSAQLSKHIPYDLLIVQYGLNVISNQSYNGYKKLMISAIKHLQECYPGVPILMMSIGDKGSKSIDGINTHPGVLPLINTQRQIAKETGICFWNTYQAMGGEHSMIRFVNHVPPMAAKDYTHINVAGGDFIGERLYCALMWEQKRLIQ